MLSQMVQDYRTENTTEAIL